ncbi:MAG: barstar family protein [Clostridia bacterium]|nr:barstar family protein [Clostridia bacterium]
MKTVLLNGPEITHELLAEKFGFPPYYGKNLDALHDCLTDIAEDTAVILQNSAKTDPRLLAVLRDCEEENPKLKIYEG